MTTELNSVPLEIFTVFRNFSDDTTNIRVLKKADIILHINKRIVNFLLYYFFFHTSPGTLSDHAAQARRTFGSYVRL
jgi:hypothetical protein